MDMFGKRIHPRFTSDERGTLGTFFAVATLGFVCVIGLAVDGGQMMALRGELQDVADDAVLSAVAAAKPLGDAQQDAEAMFRSRVASQARLKSAAVSFTFSNDPTTDEISAEISAVYPTVFMGAIGVASATVTVKASATRKSGGARVLDVAMCMDATGSMQPTIDAVKANALNLQTSLNSYFASNSIAPFDAIRVRPIFFRDFGGNYNYDEATGGDVDKYPFGWEWRPAGDARNYGDDVPMRAAAAFFNLESDAAGFSAFVTPEVESGGGDDPESGLECLNEAMGSAWLRAGDTVSTASGDKTVGEAFSVVAIWTDQATHPPAYFRSLLNPSYPVLATMPATYGNLEAKWNDDTVIPQAHKLLATFKPASATDGWDQVTAWSGYLAAGTLVAGTGTMIERLGDAVQTLSTGGYTARLTH